MHSRMRSVARSAGAFESIGTEMLSWTTLSDGARPQNQLPRERDHTKDDSKWRLAVSTRIAMRPL